ncbi:MAG: hypothetical protein M0T79_05300 [Actinomycetota bacterium]|jgi:hypothetical protein|nr:hypothetical protein [Actinomycetota bacterium]
MIRYLSLALKPDRAAQVTLALAGARAVIGAVAWVAPKAALKAWVGSEVSSQSGGRLLGRALGARDLALGAGAILAYRRGRPVRGWVEAGVLADAGDAVATLVGFRQLPKRTRWAVLASTVGATGLGYLVAQRVDKG